jgi:hypothetical protein
MCRVPDGVIIRLLPTAKALTDLDDQFWRTERSRFYYLHTSIPRLQSRVDRQFQAIEVTSHHSKHKFRNAQSSEA